MKQKSTNVWKWIAIAALCLLAAAAFLYIRSVAQCGALPASMPAPTEAPTPELTAEPTPAPTEEPTPAPTEEPTPEPTEEPTPEPTEEPAQRTLSHPGYTPEQVIVLSRHNARSAFMGSKSTSRMATPHEWVQWSSSSGELTVRGGTVETQMGQYFRKWLESEGTFPRNYRPASSSIRFYANSKQRTMATARFFAAGLFPLTNVSLETHTIFDWMDSVFANHLTFFNAAYQTAAEAAIRELHGDAIAALADNFEVIAETIDMKDSPAYRDGQLQNLDPNDYVITLEQHKEPKSSGSLNTMMSISDALILQYYEEPDAVKAAFGHDLTFGQWKQIAEVKGVWQDALYSTPLIAVNCAHPMLKEIWSEMNAKDRVFTFIGGHDTNLSAVLGALGAEKYDLPDAIERTPVGSKLVICRWRSESGKLFYSADLVYPTARQQRGEEEVALDNPPGICPLRFSDLTPNEDGLYVGKEFTAHVKQAIDEYDMLARMFPGR